MARSRLYESPAERQKAYRLRKAEQGETPPPQVQKRRPLSRPKRLITVISEVASLQAEYETWRDRLPESMLGTEQEEQLTETIDLLQEAVEVLGQINPPLGFGRQK